MLAEPSELADLRQEKLGGYIVVGELSPWGMPSYIWGPPVRAVFDTLRHGYSLQTSLHAPGVAPAIRVVTAENGVSDEALEPLFKSAEGYLRMWEKSERRGAELSQ